MLENKSPIPNAHPIEEFCLESDVHSVDISNHQQNLAGKNGESVVEKRNERSFAVAVCTLRATGCDLVPRSGVHENTSPSED